MLCGLKEGESHLFSLSKKLVWFWGVGGGSKGGCSQRKGRGVLCLCSQMPIGRVIVPEINISRETSGVISSPIPHPLSDKRERKRLLSCTGQFPNPASQTQRKRGVGTCYDLIQSPFCEENVARLNFTLMHLGFR